MLPCVTDPSHKIVVEGTASYVTEIRDALGRHGIRAQILAKPGRTNT